MTKSSSGWIGEGQEGTQDRASFNCHQLGKQRLRQTAGRDIRTADVKEMVNVRFEADKR
jgi:hypothetical protein